MLRSLAALAFCLVLSGCLPNSCRREEDRTLLAQDSLSLARADAAPVDTLRLAWQSEPDALDYPRTLRWGPGGLYAVDAEQAAVFVFDRAGRVVRRVETELEAPYLAGFRGDSLVLFQPTPAAFAVLDAGGAARRVEVKGLPDDRGLLRYASTWREGFAFKGLSEDTPPFLLTLDASGAPTGRYPLPSPFWRWAGLLKPDVGGGLLSLSGFRPYVDVIDALPAAGDTLRPDTRALEGFAAPVPILARSRRFALGAEIEPPLLTSSTSAAGERLFVLNMRPGWLRIDVYDRDGTLERALTQPNPSAGKDFFPVDIAVREAGAGFDIAVALVSPEPRVVVYRWAGP